LNILHLKKDIFGEADRARLIQVISNLLNNALKFKDYCTVSVLLQSNQDEATVSISDTGHGIDPQILSRLLQNLQANRCVESGWGYISKSIVEAHGGSILGKNIIDEKGATFTLVFRYKENQLKRLYQILLQNKNLYRKKWYFIVRWL
jgi:signal transduction histidine kinase